MGKPVILTVKVDENFAQRQFFKGIGLMKLPVTLTDNQQNVYEVYVKGQLEMDDIVKLMEHVEYIGKEMVYGNLLGL